MDLLKKISGHLMLYSCFTDNMGLLHGKMGATLFFFHYYHYTRKKIYEKYAHELLEQIEETLHTGYPWDFSNGLAGIAYGFSYLLDKQWIHSSSVEILDDMDQLLLHVPFRDSKQENLYQELEWLFIYLSIRATTGRKRGNKKYKEGMEGIKDFLSGNPSGTENLHRKQTEPFAPDILINHLINQTHFNPSRLFEEYHSIGIANNGYAGIGIQLIWKQLKGK